VADEGRDRVRRRLAAIVVVRCELVAPTADEAESFTGLRTILTDVVEPAIAIHGGNIFKRAADRVLAEFDSVVEATRAAVALRDAAEKSWAAGREPRMAVHIGINLGDIIVEDGDIFGDGVNIAARLEALAEPGSVYLSEMVHNHVADKLPFEFAYLGPKDLKNIARPVRVYRIGGATSETPQASTTTEAEESTTAAPFDDRRAIAVLPFANFSGDPQQEFFADGITEDIIAVLAGWRAFPVIARNSTFTYKGRAIDIKKVSQELGVRYVLEGSVRKSGRRVRITAQLIEADSGHHIVAERYDRDLTDLFELQDEIAAAIAGAIQPELLKHERERVAARPQHDEDAYALYQRGMWHHYRHTKEDNVEAQALFRRALAIDPQYPQAAAALAIAVLNVAYLGWADDTEGRYAEAYELAGRAAALDRRYPNAHFALGAVCMWTRRAERAVAAFEEAINLNPSFAAAHVLLGQMYLYGGRPEEAIEQAEKGIRLSPSDPRLFIWLTALAGAHYQLGNYQKAVEIGRRSWTLKRNWPGGLRYVVAGLAELGRLDEAKSALAELKLLNPSLAFVEGNLRRLFTDGAAVDRIVGGLRKAGFE
jgi:adenylate cyclase